MLMTNLPRLLYLGPRFNMGIHSDSRFWRPTWVQCFLYSISSLCFLVWFSFFFEGIAVDPIDQFLNLRCYLWFPLVVSVSKATDCDSFLSAISEFLLAVFTQVPEESYVS